MFGLQAMKGTSGYLGNRDTSRQGKAKTNGIWMKALVER